MLHSSLTGTAAAADGIRHGLPTEQVFEVAHVARAYHELYALDPQIPQDVVHRRVLPAVVGEPKRPVGVDRVQTSLLCAHANAREMTRQVAQSSLHNHAHC